MTDEDVTLAGELALGLLDGEDRAMALRRTLADRAFARAVEWWRDRLAGLVEGIPEVAAPHGEPVEPTPVAARVTRVWQAIAAVTTTAAAAALVLLFLQPRLPEQRLAPVSPPLVATLGTPDGAFSVLYDRAGEVRVVPAPRVEHGKEAVAWAIVGSAAPRAVGVLSPGSSRIAVSTAIRRLLAPGTTIAVSLEDAGVPVGDAPRGPVIASGVLAL